MAYLASGCGRIGFDLRGGPAQGDDDDVTIDAMGSASIDAAVATGSFGTMQIGVSTQNTGADRVWMSRFSLAEAAQVQTVVAHLGPTAGTSTVRGIIYADASGTPTTLLGTTTNVMVDGASQPDWRTLPFASPVALAPGMYWIGTHTSVQLSIAYQSATGASKFNNDTFSDGTDATYGGGAQTFTLELSIYAEYTR